MPSATSQADRPARVFLLPLRHPAWAAAVGLPALVFALYWRALARGFTSEDFLLVRALGEHPPWRDLATQLTRPWLGISGIEFFRPVSTLLFGLEVNAFGPQARGYLVVHLLVHATSALLVWGIARQLARQAAGRGQHEALAGLAAVFFAAYPLHPNAVVFVASFATLFGGCFALLALYAYQRFRAGASRWWWAAALGAFCLAAASYEAAVVVPIWLAAYDQLVVAADGRGRRALLRAWAPFLPLLAAYFAWRHFLFGGFVGGYAETRERMLAPASLGGDLLRSVHLLHLPLFERPAAPSTVVLTVLLIVGGPLVLFALDRESARSTVRPWIFGWTITVTAIAPFAFRPVVPANGRYWYLASAGAAISLAFVLAALGGSPGRRLRPAVAWLAAASIVGFWVVELAKNVEHTRRAALLARHVQAEVVRTGRSSPGSPRLFVTGHPAFLTNDAGVNLAQVFHYGLRDAAGPPFAARPLPVFPLPPLRGAELLPVILGAPRAAVLAWNGEAGRLQPAPLVDAGGLTELEVLPAPADGSGASPRPGTVAVRIPAGPHARFRLLLSAPINGTARDIPAGDRQGDVLRTALPADFLDTSRQLYDGPAFWWIEARDEGGRLVGFTRLRRVFEPAARDDR
jgi:hypothetical protein